MFGLRQHEHTWHCWTLPGITRICGRSRRPLTQFNLL